MGCYASCCSMRARKRPLLFDSTLPRVSVVVPARFRLNMTAVSTATFCGSKTKTLGLAISSISSYEILRGVAALRALISPVRVWTMVGRGVSVTFVPGAGSDVGATLSMGISNDGGAAPCCRGVPLREPSREEGCGDPPSLPPSPPPSPLPSPAPASASFASIAALSPLADARSEACISEMEPFLADGGASRAEFLTSGHATPFALALSLALSLWLYSRRSSRPSPAASLNLSVAPKASAGTGEFLSCSVAPLKKSAMAAASPTSVADVWAAAFCFASRRRLRSTSIAPTIKQLARTSTPATTPAIMPAPPPPPPPPRAAAGCEICSGVGARVGEVDGIGAAVGVVVGASVCPKQQPR